MVSTPTEAIAELKAREFPRVFLGIWQEDVPRPLMADCAMPQKYFMVIHELHGSFPRSRDYLPLWETNLEYIIAYDMARRLYVRYHYGDAEDEVLGRTYQQFITAFLLELVESGVVDDIDPVARVFEYRYADRLKAFVQTPEGDNYVEEDRRFIDSIPD